MKCTKCGTNKTNTLQTICSELRKVLKKKVFQRTSSGALVCASNMRKEEKQCREERENKT